MSLIRRGQCARHEHPFFTALRTVLGDGATVQFQGSTDVTDSTAEQSWWASVYRGPISVATAEFRYHPTPWPADRQFELEHINSGMRGAGRRLLEAIGIAADQTGTTIRLFLWPSTDREIPRLAHIYTLAGFQGEEARGEEWTRAPQKGQRAARGHRAVRAHPCKDWQRPDTSKLQGSWQRAPAATLFHARLEPSQGCPLQELVLCPKIPRYGNGDEGKTARNCFSSFGAAEAFMALHAWDWFTRRTRIQHVPGIAARRFHVTSFGEPDHIEIPTGPLPSLLIYTNKLPIETYRPTTGEVYDAAITGEVWDVRPSPVRLVQRLAPIPTLLLRQEVWAFHNEANEEGLEQATENWGLGDVDPSNYDYLGDWEEVQYWTTPALDYMVSIIQHHLDLP